MPLEKYYDPWKKNSFLYTTDNVVDWRGTPGMGDVLFGLNAVHMLVHLARKKREIPFTTMNFYWRHDENYLHHYEDPETIIERANYLNNFYHDKDAVKIVHLFNTNDDEIEEIRHRGFRRVAGPTAVLDGIPCWMFRRDAWCDNPVENKFVFWRPLFNAEKAAAWKRAFSNADWERMIGILQRRGFNPVEITYRTPVREAFYHINTARFCIYYDGMWQYIAKNLCKPSIALGNSSIIDVHNPHAVRFYKPDENVDSIFKYIKSIHRNLGHIDKRANKYRKFILGELNVEDRPRSN